MKLEIAVQFVSRPIVSIMHLVSIVLLLDVAGLSRDRHVTSQVTLAFTATFNEGARETLFRPTP